VRTVRASVAAIHNSLTNALGAQGFRLTADQLTYLEAKRGSALMGTVDKSRLGVSAKAWVTPQNDDCQVQIRLQYQGIPLTGGAQGYLREVFVDVGRAIDLALARLDPNAVFVPATLTTAGQGGPLNEAIDLGVASQGLAKPDASRSVPAAWTAREGVLFTLDDRLAWLDPAAAQAHLAIARLVLDRPGALPETLKAELEPFAVRLEQSIAANPDGLAVVTISGDDRPVLAFLHQQVRIRSGLPVRTLHRCRDCHLEKTTNPEYQRTQQQSRALRSLGGAVGATISRGGISPFVLVGTLFNMRRLEPDYVCPRCQGMSAEETLVTYCKNCGGLKHRHSRCPRLQWNRRRPAVPS
jgi:uncharacterized protein (DUF2267 family)